MAFEGGLKSRWAGRVTTNLSVFSIDWTDLQLNMPNLLVPGQFFISNVGPAREQRRRGRGERPRP